MDGCAFLWMVMECGRWGGLRAVEWSRGRLGGQVGAPSLSAADVVQLVGGAGGPDSVVMVQISRLSTHDATIVFIWLHIDWIPHVSRFQGCCRAVAH